MKELKEYLYYHEDGPPTIDIYKGNALEIMPFLPKVDLIACDPPYGLNYNGGSDLASQREAAFGGDKEKMKPRPIQTDGEDESKILFEAFLKIANDKLLKGGACCCCCCCCGGGGPKPLFAEWTLMMDKAIGFKQAVVWDKGGLGMGMHYRRNYEFILIAQKKGPKAHRWNGGNDTPNVWRIGKIIPNENQHPTIKPVELMDKIIRIHSNEGDLVLDAFMGSGTTLVSAKALKRNAIGIELEDRWCEKAKKRLMNTQVPFL